MKHLLLFSPAYTTWWQRPAAHKTPYLNMADAEEPPEAVHPNQGMANSLPLLTKFDETSKLNQADLWPKWLRRFERYRIASGLQNKTEQEQVGTLLYANMGECADDIITTLRVNEETASYTDVRAALNGYFAARRNTIVERARFNTRKQRPEESLDTFIQDLYRIAEDCGYGALKDQLIGEVFFLGEINSASSDYWTAQAEVNGHNTLFKLDAGAAVTVLSDNVEWLRSISPTETSQTLHGPGNIRLPVQGQFHATLKYGQTSITETVYVLHNQTCSLLSSKACVELGLIKRAEKDVKEVNCGPTDFKAEFPLLFTGLGRLKAECHITIPADAKPFCLYNPRKLPHPITKGEKSDRDNA